MKDRVTVIFSTLFKDDDDIVISKVFMQVRMRTVVLIAVAYHMKCLTFMALDMKTICNLDLHCEFCGIIS